MAGAAAVPRVGGGGPGPVGGRVLVVGLADFQRELRALDSTLPRELRQVNKAAAEFVAEKARALGASLGGVHAKTAPSIKAQAEQRAAKVSIGGARYPFALGAEFGATKYRQFPAWRGNQWSPDGGANVGYMVHPTIRETRDEFLEVYGDALAELLHRAFPQGRTAAA